MFVVFSVSVVVVFSVSVVMAFKDTVFNQTATFAAAATTFFATLGSAIPVFVVNVVVLVGIITIA